MPAKGLWVGLEAPCFRDPHLRPVQRQIVLAVVDIIPHPGTCLDAVELAIVFPGRVPA